MVNEAARLVDAGGRDHDKGPVGLGQVDDLGLRTDVLDETDARHVHKLGHTKHLDAGQVADQQRLLGGLVEQVTDPVAGVDVGDLGGVRLAWGQYGGADLGGQFWELHVRPREQWFQVPDDGVAVWAFRAVLCDDRLERALPGEEGRRLQRRGDVDVLDVHVGRQAQRHGCEADDTAHTGAHQAGGDCLRVVRWYRYYGDAHTEVVHHIFHRVGPVAAAAVD